MSSDLQQKAEELRRQIDHHNYLYYVEAKPVISDREFDLLLKEMEEIERAHPELAEGPLRMKDTADVVAWNAGKTGGPLAKAAHVRLGAQRDLERLGDHLHAQHRAVYGCPQQILLTVLTRPFQHCLAAIQLEPGQLDLQFRVHRLDLVEPVLLHRHHGPGLVQLGAPYVRHPSHGGADAFRRQLETALCC